MGYCTEIQSILTRLLSRVAASRRQCDLATVYSLLRPVPRPDMPWTPRHQQEGSCGSQWPSTRRTRTFSARRYDTLLFETNPTQWILVNSLRLLGPLSDFFPHVRNTALTITGGNSAVRVRDSTACSIDSSPSALCDVRLEFERSRVVTWLSVRCRPKGTCEDTLPLCRTEDYGDISRGGRRWPVLDETVLLLVDAASPR